METLEGKNLFWIVYKFDPQSKIENVIYNCAKWLLNSGNSECEFESISEQDSSYMLKFDDEGLILIKACWNDIKWKWEFNHV